eukprot:1041202-Heterocapsa_arctica.AAC.1
MSSRATTERYAVDAPNGVAARPELSSRCSACIGPSGGLLLRLLLVGPARGPLPQRNCCPERAPGPPGTYALIQHKVEN